MPLKRLDTTLSGGKDNNTPLWFMRQAGRYLPEYRAIRAGEADFTGFCLNPPRAAEVTLQPITRYGLDAAIIFSDILMIPWALGRGVHFVENEGPRMTPLENLGVEALADIAGRDIFPALAPVCEAVRLTREQLADDINLIGFCGAPWTVATYMIEGGRSDFAKSGAWVSDDPVGMARLLDILADYSVSLLAAKHAAGADTLMIFDSWAGEVPPPARADIIHAPTKRIIDGLRAKGITAPVIGFAKGLGDVDALAGYAEATGITAIGLDHGIDPVAADRALPKNLPVQGNLDPALLLAGGRDMLVATDGILEAFATRPHIFNLGHGIDKATPPEHVAELVAHIRAGGGK